MDAVEYNVVFASQGKSPWRKVNKVAQKQRPAIREGDAPDAATNGAIGNRVHFTMAKTINIGNYESIRVEYGESRVVQDGESFGNARTKAVTSVMQNLQALADTVTSAMTS